MTNDLISNKPVLEDIQTGAPVDNSVPSQQGIRSSIPGYPASASEITAAQASPQELLLREIEDTIVAYQPATFILGTIASKAAVKRFSGSMEIDFYALGSDRISSVTGVAVIPPPYAHTVTLNLPDNDVMLFSEDTLVKVRGVQGYADDGKTLDPIHELLLQVIARDELTRQPVFYAINGYKSNPADSETFVPRIPLNTTIYLLNTAAAESQLFTTPSSYIPRPCTAFMQRKLLNIQVSRYFDSASKKVRWGKEDILEAAIREFRRRSEINYLEGVQSRRMTHNPSRHFAGQEFIYTSEGLISQIRQQFHYDPGNFTFADFLRLSEILFADNNGSKRSLLCVGRKLAVSILSLQYTLTKELSIDSSSHWGINMTDFSSLFGTISLVHYPILDQIGREEQGFAIDVARLIRYVHRGAYTENIDMSVHGEDAQRDVYVETDCLVLKGDNHVFISPTPANSNPPVNSNPPLNKPRKVVKLS
jgi:hypothetical protein